MISLDVVILTNHKTQISIQLINALRYTLCFLAVLSFIFAYC